MEQLTYRKASARLEEIIHCIEHENPDVDELTQMVEEAIELMVFCRNKLTQTDRKLEELMARINAENGVTEPQNE